MIVLSKCGQKKAGLETYRHIFRDIASADVDGFDEQSDADVFTVWDDLVASQRLLSKASFAKKEVAAGFNLCLEGLLSDHVLKEALPPSSFLLDSMHIYWSNGVVSWEAMRPIRSGNSHPLEISTKSWICTGAPLAKGTPSHGEHVCRTSVQGQRKQPPVRSTWWTSRLTPVMDSTRSSRPLTNASSMTTDLSCPVRLNACFTSCPADLTCWPTVPSTGNSSELEKHGIKIPSGIAGWLLLRRSNLTSEQKHPVQAQAGPELESHKAEEVLYYKSKTDKPSWSPHKVLRLPRNVTISYLHRFSKVCTTPHVWNDLDTF